jgi:hypothetical protein
VIGAGEFLKVDELEEGYVARNSKNIYYGSVFTSGPHHSSWRLQQVRQTFLHGICFA